MSHNKYAPATDRYSNSVGYQPCGKSGLQLPNISLGLWHNFGDVDDADEALKMIQFAFDHGITHFDLANNYGTPFGSAEKNFGKILKEHFASHRDEMIISSKAGHLMWDGPYGDGGSRKYMMASLHQSLQRMKLDYVDIFYSHRYDANTPLEETMGALSDMVKQGKALYIGISKYPADKAREAYRILRENGTPCLINQDRYNIFTRDIEQSVLPLAEKVEQIKKLNDIAAQRGQTLAQMALVWCLHQPVINSVIVGTSSVKQLQDNIDALKNSAFTDDELWRIGELGA